MSQGALKVLVISDNRPGHYHLSDGVAAAIARRRKIVVQRLIVKRRTMVPNAVLRTLLANGTSPDALLQVGYGISARDLKPADLVISAGGNTVIANVAAARALSADNIYCGSLKKIPPDHLTLVVSSYASHRDRPRHIVALKPSGLDQAALGRKNPPRLLRDGNRPHYIGLLIGGDSGLFRYDRQDWQDLAASCRTLSQAWGVRWLISTSRRTDRETTALFNALTTEPDVVERLIDYGSAGPGTLESVFRQADAILCTEDSSTMISEAISAGLPVVGVAPPTHDFKPDEKEYRALMLEQGWCQFLPIASLTPERFEQALTKITAMKESPLDRLAEQLAIACPQFFV